MEARLFPEGTIPEYTTPEWYAGRERAPHLEEPAHRDRIETTLTLVELALALDPAASTVVDVGAGDGGVLQRLGRPGLDCWGYDLQPENLAGAAERGVDVSYLDVVEAFGEIRWADVVVATEFLEHIVDPHGFLAGIPGKVRWLVASSPVNETAESHYAFHAWAWDQEGYAAMIETAGFHVTDHRVVGDYGFQVILAGR